MGEAVLREIAKCERVGFLYEAGVGLVHAREHLQQRRLAGAVRSTEADTIAVADLPRHVLEQGLLAERFCYILQLEQELFAERPRRRGKHLRHTEWLG